MGIFRYRCSCGAKVLKSSKFCPECGKVSPLTIINCPFCKKEVLAKRKVCPHCGTPIGESAREPIIGNRWVRVPGDFATRVEAKDIPGMFKKGLIVEEGTKALIFQEGKFAGVLSAGKYDIGGFYQRLINPNRKLPVTAVLIDASDVACNLVFENILTRDKVSLNVICQVTVRLEEGGAEKFFMNLLKSRKQYRISDLEIYLKDGVKGVISDLLAEWDEKNLINSHELIRKLIEQQMKVCLKGQLDRSGLAMIELKSVAFK